MVWWCWGSQRQVEADPGKAQPMDTTGCRCIWIKPEIPVPISLCHRVSQWFWKPFLPSLLPFSPTSPLQLCVQSTGPSLSPFASCSLNFSPTREAFQGPKDPQMHPGLPAPLIKEHVNKLYFGDLPVLLQGAGACASFPLKQWVGGSDNAFANCTHYLFSTICHKFSSIIVLLLNK